MIKIERSIPKYACGVSLVLLFVFTCQLVGASLRASLILSMLLLAVTFLRLECSRKKLSGFLACAAFILCPAAVFFTGQIMQNCSLTSVPVHCVLLNICIMLILQLLVLLASGSFRLSLILGIVLPTGLVLINTYVYAFRGNALMPSDFLSLGTAINVAAEYCYTPDPPMVYALAIISILVLGIWSLPPLRLARTWRSSLCLIGAMVLCAVVVSCGRAYIPVRHWDNRGSHYSGFLLNFTYQLQEVFVPEPDGYSPDAVAALEADYSELSSDSRHPDIIVIMNESFADFRVFKNGLATDKEVTPFLDALQENTVRGHLYASVFGGSTANSEYEFLCGHTMAFLPAGSIVYQQFFDEDSFTLLDVLKKQCYDCIAMHPYHPDGWMRSTVYPAMGFDAFYTLDDFPQKQLFRDYVSDREMYEQIIALHQTHPQDKPLFLFGITMQNHGGYTYEGSDFQNTIHLQGYTGGYPEAEQYLSSIHESDRALEYLVEYYRSVDRDVIIVFFGDHQPNIESGFYEALNGGTYDTLDEHMDRYCVPFFIWANFDIPEKELPCSSINYLPGHVLNAAGIPLPPYYRFLQRTEALIPAISAEGYYSLENQCFMSLEDAAGEEAAAIDAYRILQYNNMFDRKNRSSLFFGNE